MNSDTGKMTGKDNGVLVPSAMAMNRFRRPLIDYLLSVLEENDKLVRILAAEMLGIAGEPRALEYLKPLLVNRDRDLRIISAQAMDMILSQQAVVSRSQPDPCASCMIRLIADEVLKKQKQRG
jgi:HEAT repeat protein